MNDIISRLEAATGPSRELDAEIALANGWTRVRVGSEPCWREPRPHGGGEFHPQPPRYTESFDAAHSLLGERPAVLKFKNANGKAEARIGALPGEGFMIKGGEHSTPAISLVIAILRARESK